MTYYTVIIWLGINTLSKQTAEAECEKLNAPLMLK